MKLITHRAIVILFTILTSSTVYADLVALTFDELPEQSVNGLTIQGLTFGYDGTFSNYHGVSGPINATFLKQPYLDGHTNGTLTLDFSSPTPLLEFGISYRNAQTFTAAATVELFDKSLKSIGQFEVSTMPLLTFTEGRFIYTGTPIRRAVINFDETINAFFHLDNLKFIRDKCRKIKIRKLKNQRELNGLVK